MNKRIDREIRTVSLMIGMYCRKKHHTGTGLCELCATLERYALRQTENCRFGEDKPVCSACPVHCYKRDRRKKIREVMQFAGPGMIWHHPILALQHMADKSKDKSNQNKFKTYNIK